MIIKDIFIPILTGALLTLAYPPFKLGFLAYFGLLPVFYIAKNVSAKRAFIRGLFWGLGLNSTSLYWICYDTVKGGVASIIYLSFMISIIFIFINCAEKRFGKYFIFMFPFMWTAWELLRAIGIFGFPWLSIAYTQTYYTSLIQFASITGVYGVSFWICLINIIIYYVIYNLKIKNVIMSFAILLMIFAVPFIYSNRELKKDMLESNSLKIALIQGNIPPKIKLQTSSIRSNFDTYVRLTRDASQKKPDIYIWPESATYSYIRYNSLYFNLLKEVANEMKVPIFTGALDIEYDKSGDKAKYYNSAFLISPFSDSLEVYSKIHLVPFSEWVPFGDIFPFLYNVDIATGDFSRGKDFTIFTIPKKLQEDKEFSLQKDIRFSAVICFESIFSDLVRQFCKKGAEFLIVITNDAWFGKSTAPYQHTQIAVFRSIENRIPIARCANTGISMFIDKMGRIIKQSKIFTESILIGNICLRNEETFYTRYGEIFAYIITSLGVIFMLISIVKK